VLLAVVAMITATLNGLDRIPEVLRKTARIYRMDRLRRAILIDLPAPRPILFTGVKLSVAYAFIGVIASEFNPVRLGPRLRHCLRLQQFSEPRDVCADAADPAHGNRGQRRARRGRQAPAGAAVEVMKQFGRTTLLVLALLAIWQALYLTLGETALASR